LVKWLLDPFALVGVYLALLTVVLDRGGEAPGLSLACAVVPFQLTIAAAINAMGAVGIRHSIVLNMDFDRVLIPVSAVLTELVAFGASLLLLALMMVIYGVAPTAAVLWLPVMIALTALVAAAIAYPASLLGVWMPDLRPLAISLLRALFFLAPGLVAYAEVSGDGHEWLKANPLSGLFEGFRAALLYGESPELWMLGVPALFALVVLAVVVPLYRREQAYFARLLG
jgi:ABC-type polysaccharide/polyol phosphate export permease